MMHEGLLARKGEANPATTHHGGESRFQARRIVVLPPIALHRPHDPNATRTALPRRAANMAKPFQAPIHRRKFTFRVEPERHAAFCAAADEMGISRQELLTRALDSYLETRETALGDQPIHDDSPRLARHHEHPTMLQLPF